MTAGFSPDTAIRLRDTRTDRLLLLLTVLCLGLAIGGSVVGIIETLAPARCVASWER